MARRYLKQTVFILTMGCCRPGECLSRTIIFAVNTVILLLTIILVIVFVAIKNKAKYKAFYNLAKSSPVIVYCLVLLAILGISSIFGFFLICCTNKCWRRTYFFFACVILILQVVAVILTSTQRGRVFKQVSKTWKVKEGVNPEEQAYYLFENFYNCCTFDDNHSGIEYKINNENYTCGCNFTETGLNATTVENCSSALNDTINDTLTSSKTSTIVCVVVEFLVFICAFYLACCLPDKNKDDSITYVN